MLNYITFNGVTSTDAGINGVEKYPDLNRPARKVEVVNVPGRSGDIVFEQEAWENVERSYEIYAGSGSRGTAPGTFVSIASWLNSAKGYARLEDTYEPDHFRLAYCIGAFEAENYFTRYGQATITFNCRPERFLKTGTTAVAMAYSDTITNPTDYNAKPLIKISCTGTAARSVGFTNNGTTYTIDFLEAPTTPVYVDCELMDCYTAAGENKNGSVSIDEYPIFGPGETELTMLSSGYSVEVTPRWFVI